MEIRKVITSFVDHRGELEALDFSVLPFTPERLFILGDIPSKTIRGEHGHLATDQYLIVLMGVMELFIIRENGEAATVDVQKGEGIFIPRKTWIRMTFISPSRVLVLASSPYSEEDYFHKPPTPISQENVN